MALVSEVIQRGLRANQPAPGTALPDAPAGHLYCVTDEGNIVEQSTGTSWAQFGNTDTTIKSVGIAIDGSGSTITTGVKAYLQIPFSGTITGVTLLADTTGSVVADLWIDQYANYPPTSGHTITGGNKPTITSGIKYTDSILTGWTTSIAASDVIAFNIDSATTIQKLTIELNITTV